MRKRALLNVFVLVAVPVGVIAQQAAPKTPEHETLLSLAGDWEVLVGEPSEITPVGTAEARARLGGRFLEVELTSEAGPVTHAIYTLAFDDRHGEFAVILMDSSGNYFVTARGTADESGKRIAMYGKDDDPAMAQMGFEKEFVIVLHLRDDGFALETVFIDTRTAARNELPFIKFEFRRPAGY